jgi:hypothetical protein
MPPRTSNVPNAGGGSRWQPARGADDLNDQGLRPNQFTQAMRGSERASLPAPNARPTLPAANEADVAHMQRTRDAAEHARRMETLGWSGEGLSGEWRARFSGASDMYPNMQAKHGTSTINAPHQTTLSVPVGRRWEDLSGAEQDTVSEQKRREGYGGLSKAQFPGHYGGRAEGTESPMEHYARSKEDANYRAVARNNMAGTQEDAVQHFYGGAPVTTKFDDPAHQARHNDVMTEGPRKFDDAVGQIRRSDEFAASMKEHGIPEHLHDEAARSVAGVAVADTSPQLKFYQPRKNGTVGWPNLESARSAVHGAMTGTTPYKENPDNPGKNLQGTDGNRERAKDHVLDMMRTGNFDSGLLEYSPKTSPFNGGVVNPHTADALTVRDVQEGNSEFPSGAKPADVVKGRASTQTSEMVHAKNGMSAKLVTKGRPGNQTVTPRLEHSGGFNNGAEKSTVWTHPETGKPVELFPDEDPSKVAGHAPKMVTRTKTAKDGTTTEVSEQARGQSRGEWSTSALPEGLQHAAGDYAARQAAANMGVSRGVEYADNAHPHQATRWGGEKLDRLSYGSEESAFGHHRPVHIDNGTHTPLTDMMAAHASGDQSHMNATQFSGLAKTRYVESPHMDNHYDPSRDMRTGGYI